MLRRSELHDEALKNRCSEGILPGFRPRNNPGVRTTY
jgi:hypothetical protein